MKKLRYIILCLAALTALSSCSKNDPVIFDDAFIYVADRNGNAESTIDWDSQNYLGVYNVYLVSPKPKQDITVEYDLVVGDGLAEDVDYKLISSTKSPLYFARGIYMVPIRIEWLKHELDPAKNNSLRIVLRACSDPSVTIGKLGPNRLGNSYTITKQ